MNCNPVPSLECILERSLAHKIIERSVEVTTQDGILFRQGESGDCLYFVQWGEVSLTMLVGNREIRIRAGRGSLLGLPAVFGNQMYTMTAKATWDAEIFKISSNAFTELLNREPRMKETVLQVLAGEVRAIRLAFSQLI
jgi:CRP-like cAMP-binding protein